MSNAYPSRRSISLARGALAIPLVLLILPLLASCDSASPTGSRPKPERWRFAIEETAGSVQHAYAEKFKELVEARSQGEVEVTVYPYGTLGTSDALTEQLDMRVIQFAMASPGHLGKLIPEVQVFLLHFIFSDDPELNSRVLNRDPQLQQKFDELYARKGLRLLSIFSEGWQVWTADRPIRWPEDFAGLKIRVMTSPLLLAAYRAYGASPTPLPYSEVYSALQLNMIDAQENPVFAIEEMSFYEVSDWMIFARHAPFVATAVTNREFYQSLPPKRQAMLDGVIDELNEYILDVQRQYNAERLETIRQNKPTLNIIEELTDEQRSAFREASLPVRQWFVETVGGDAEEILTLLLERIAAAQAEERG